MESITFYDYENHPVKVKIPENKEISLIYVTVLSGDEVGMIVFTDNSEQAFDTSTERVTPTYQGSYDVTRDELDKFINCVHDGEYSSNARARMCIMCGEEYDNYD